MPFEIWFHLTLLFEWPQSTLVPTEEIVTDSAEPSKFATQTLCYDHLPKPLNTSSDYLAQAQNLVAELESKVKHYSRSLHTYMYVHFNL